MLNGRSLCLDTMGEVYDLLRPWADHEFWNLAEHDVVRNSIYVIGRQQIVECRDRVREMCQDDSITVVFGNSAEGSRTLIDQCERVLGLGDLIDQRRLLLVSGGDLPDHYPFLHHEHFLVRVLDYDENIEQSARMAEIFAKSDKPYTFLFLNGRARPHRKYLVERLGALGLLDRALWTMLDGRRTEPREFQIMVGGEDRMATNTPIRLLPEHYEVSRYRARKPIDDYPHQFVKPEIFRFEWGDIYLQAEPYIDTYFSLVTETVYDMRHSFRTEKIAKPLAMGHPWICAANAGFYRDLRNLGFRTFHDVIDESFDLIDDHRARMDRVIQVVQDVCQQDLQAFLRATEPVCKYNQQFLPEFIREHRKEFPGRFQSFLRSHARS